MKKSESLFKTNENEYIKYCLYPYNSISSISYILTGICLFDYNILYSYNLIFLGIFSTLWWAFQYDYYHFYDKFLYSLNFFLIGYLNDSFISNRYLLYNMFVYYFFNDDSTIIITSNILCSIYSFYILYTLEKYYEMNIFVLSILFKLNDTYNIIKINQIIPGTALFHLLSAYGIYLLFK